MYCPNCGDEYREGFKVCFDCGAELVKDILEENKVEYNSISYKIFFVFLFLFNLFSIKYQSLCNIGPGWEIPANLVTH